jgi:hypothetical protein
VPAARAALLNGKDFDPATYAKTLNCLRRLLQDIGQHSRMKDITPSIADYVKAFTTEDSL